MTNSAEPSTPSGPFRNSTTKATDHELQKYDNFTRYGQPRLPLVPANSREAELSHFGIQLTPSFFCRLDDEVVYWNTSRFSG